MHTEWTSRHETSVPALTRTNAHLDIVALAHSPGWVSGVCMHSSSRDQSKWSTAPFFAVEMAAVCSISCSRGLEVGALDGGAKGEGETDEEVDATGCEGSVS
jgi:hypothetical protein